MINLVKSEPVPDQINTGTDKMSTFTVKEHEHIDHVTVSHMKLNDIYIERR